jgi:hypothetical protein
MSRIYVASSWRNEYQPVVVEMLRMHGHSVYDFRNPPNGVPGFAWEAAGMPDRTNLKADIYRQILTTSPICALGYQNDMRGMEWADTCVLVLPCGRSAHLEAGWFAGRGKRCIILTQDNEEPELMALMATDICISIAEVIDVLKS